MNVISFFKLFFKLVTIVTSRLQVVTIRRASTNTSRKR